jgi:hypothetical protein
MSTHNLATSRLARQLIASAPDVAQQLNDELRGQSWSEEECAGCRTNWRSASDM